MTITERQLTITERQLIASKVAESLREFMFQFTPCEKLAVGDLKCIADAARQICFDATGDA